MVDARMRDRALGALAGVALGDGFLHRGDRLLRLRAAGHPETGDLNAFRPPGPALGCKTRRNRLEDVFVEVLKPRVVVHRQNVEPSVTQEQPCIL